MNEFLENLKRQAAENPAAALAITAGLIGAISQLMNASANKKNSVAWQKEVNRRDRMSRR